MRGVYFRTEKDGTPLATPELRISATNNRTVYYDDATARDAAMQAGEIKEGSIVLTGYADGESEVLMKQEIDWERVQSFTAQQLLDEYTAPEDGVIYITGRCSTATPSWITINHQKVGYYFGGSGGIIDCQVDSQVNKGDVITSSNLLTADYSGIFVPFKTVAEPLTLPVNVMNNPSLPDYSRAITLTISDFPYTAPADGAIMMNVASSSTATGGSGDRTVYVNNVEISKLIAALSSGQRPTDLYIPLSKNDVVSFSNSNADVNIRSGHFIPFKS